LKSELEIKTKIKQLKQEVGSLEEEFEEFLEDEGIQEYSEQWEKPNQEFEAKKEVLEREIKALEWVSA